MSRVRARKVERRDGSDVPPDVIARGYEVSKGRYVIVTGTTLASLQPRATHDRPRSSSTCPRSTPCTSTAPTGWHPMTGRPSRTHCWSRPWKAGKVAVARFVMRAKRYVAVMRPPGRTTGAVDDGGTRTEISPPPTSTSSTSSAVECPKQELTMAEQLIESLSASSSPGLQDSYPRRAPRPHTRDQGAGEGGSWPCRGSRRGPRSSRPDGRARGVGRRSPCKPAVATEHAYRRRRRSQIEAVSEESPRTRPRPTEAGQRSSRPGAVRRRRHSVGEPMARRHRSASTGGPSTSTNLDKGPLPGHVDRPGAGPRHYARMPRRSWSPAGPVQLTMRRYPDGVDGPSFFEAVPVAPAPSGCDRGGTR